MKTRSTIDYKGAKTVNICVVRKIGYSHTEAFREAAERIEEECRRKEISCTTRSKEDKFADLNIVIGSHLEPSKILQFDKSKCLIINLERLQALNKIKENECYIKILTTFQYIDFSSANTDYCERENIPQPLYLYRPWFEEKWKRVINEIEKTWDVCLIGSITPRRQAIIEQLEQAGLSVTSRFDCYSYERDEVLSKSKICINIHAYEGNKTAEIWRLNYVAANQVRIISETCDMEAGEEEIAKGLTQATYENLSECVLNCIHKETALEREKHANVFYEIVKMHELRHENLQYPSSISPKPTLINIGCGNNWREDAINIDIKSTGFEDLVLDISQNWENINTKHKTRRFGEIHLSENSFDAIEASCVLEHVKDLQTTLINIMKLLKPGGWLYLRYPHQDSLGAWQDPTHLRGMNEHLIKYLNEWGYYLGLGDMRATPKWIKFIEEDEKTKINTQDKKRMGFIETVLTKRIIDIPQEESTRMAIKDSITQSKDIGTSSLREALHRRTYIQQSKGLKEGYAPNKFPTVSILTPTYGERFKYLGLAWKWIKEQNYPHDLMEWVLLTDTDEERDALKIHLNSQHISPSINIIIKSSGSKLLIGDKRNQIHKISSGEILINFDDDDYYFPDRVSHAVNALTADTTGYAELAGCQYLPVFFTDDQCLWVSDPGENRACAGSFAYKRSLIQQTWYPSKAKNGEEIAFTDYWEIPKIDLDPFSTMICIAHSNNTFDKDKLRAEFKEDDSKTIQAKGITYKGDRDFFRLSNLRKNKITEEWQKLYLEAGMSDPRYLELPHELFKVIGKKSVLDYLSEYAINRVTKRQ